MIKFLSCDWGTSSFRLRLVSVADMSTVAFYSSKAGINKVFTEWNTLSQKDAPRVGFYYARILKGIEHLEKETGKDLSELLIICSGMASSSVGIRELPYTSLPFDVRGEGLEMHLFPLSEERRQSLLLLSGLRTENNVMRGEETQLVGIITQMKDFGGDGQFIFPGTHSKHITVQNSKVTGFHTCMTGELFSLLSQHSILANSVAEGLSLSDEAGRRAFKKGVLEGAAHPIISRLFHVRTNELFKYLKKEENYHYLSGLLIGGELGILAVRQNKLPLFVCPDNNLYQQYSLALECLGIDCGIISPSLVEGAVVHGQFKIFNQNLNHERSIFLGSF
ncbi:2-dehydro-3-deoxygalactonokinase [Negadavirga shengliensis]|uniref:2-dehydro-3-deoxygalactonokinase n=1 Tax=Negadavirga shengliensis TaxID=1389218 RepID=A0ABV9T0A1_9BACT